MRIRELLEGTKFKHDDFVEHDGDDTKLAYDLVEDLTFFMHNNDNVYRRHLYPKIAKCIEVANSKGNINPMMFKDAATEGYKEYIKEYPVSLLPEELDDKTCKKVCEKIYDEFKNHHKEGKYKD